MREGADQTGSIPILVRNGQTSKSTPQLLQLADDSLQHNMKQRAYSLVRLDQKDSARDKGEAPH